MSQDTMDRPERATRYELTFPSENGLDQDQEWCVVRANGLKRRVRFHDYGDIYELPGLYEQLFYEHMECRSPQTVAGLLSTELKRSDVNPQSLRVLDVGAGNGMVGEELADIGAGAIVGVDIIPEAAAAAERDRPGLYDDYLVLDLTSLDEGVRRDLESRRLNALTCVAALGFGDIPPAAFAAAYDVLTPDAWLAFSIKTDFLDEEGDSGFATLIRELVDAAALPPPPVRLRRPRPLRRARGRQAQRRAGGADRRRPVGIEPRYEPRREVRRGIQNARRYASVCPSGSACMLGR